MIKLNPDSSCIIVVPTTPLKGQWEKGLKSIGVTNFEVYVINTIALNTKIYTTDLLVVDEIHLYASTEFIKLFRLVKYKWILGLTATIERLDGKEAILKKFCPIADEISHEECVLNGWVSETIEINLSVPLSRKEVEEMEIIDKSIRYYMARFGDFDIMRSCMILENAKSYARMYYKSEDPNEKAKEILVWAIQGNRFIKKRQEFLYNTQRKIDVSAFLIKELGLKTITFSQSTAFADSLTKSLGKSAVSFHSNLEPKIIVTTKTKEFKTLVAAKKYSSLYPNSKIVSKDTHVVEWQENKKVGKKYLLDDALKKFKDNRTGVTTICTAKSLDQGADIPDAELGLEAARTSNPTQRRQRRGRICRKFTYKNGKEKTGVYISLYIPNTQDEKWLRSCQKGANPLWFEDPVECVNFIKKSLNG